MLLVQLNKHLTSPVTVEMGTVEMAVAAAVCLELVSSS